MVCIISFCVHTGTAVSIFEEERQIGYYDLASFHYYNDRIAKIELNDDCNVEFITVLCFALICNFQDRSDVNINLGNISRNGRKFDTTWYPNKP